MLHGSFGDETAWGSSGLFGWAVWFGFFHPLHLQFWSAYERIKIKYNFLYKSIAGGPLKKIKVGQKNYEKTSLLRDNININNLCNGQLILKQS